MYSQLIENHLELLFLLPTADWTGALASLLSKHFSLLRGSGTQGFEYITFDSIIDL